MIGTVKGDLHDIGKNLVGSMLEGSGFEVHDLGTDVAPEKFVQAVKETNAQVICLSSLLTVTMPAMKTTITALENAGLRGKSKYLWAVPRLLHSMHSKSARMLLGRMQIPP